MRPYCFKYTLQKKTSTKSYHEEQTIQSQMREQKTYTVGFVDCAQNVINGCRHISGTISQISVCDNARGKMRVKAEVRHRTLTTSQLGQQDCAVTATCSPTRN